MDNEKIPNQIDSLSVDYPAPNGDANVWSYSPQATTGTLCYASGTASKPGPGWQGVVKLINTAYGAPAPTEADWGSAQTVGVKEDGQWPDGYMPWMGAEIAPPGVTDPNNTLYVKAVWYDYSVWPPKTREDGPSITPYRGVFVEWCPTIAQKTPASADTTPPPPSPTPASSISIDARPTGGDEGWLQYGNLAVDCIAFGNRLMLGDKPLRTSLLAVSAFDVNWWYGNRRPRLVCRAQGHIDTAPTGWMFKDSPQAAIVLWQRDLSRRHVLVSEDRAQPDVVDLDPRQDIYIQVNYNFLDLFARRGGFSLWAKALT